MDSGEVKIKEEFGFREIEPTKYGQSLEHQLGRKDTGSELGRYVGRMRLYNASLIMYKIFTII